MQNYIFKSTTLLITVKDQVKFTKQLIKFLNSQPITINIFVADGSKNKQKQLFKKLKHKYRYFYYGEDKGLYDYYSKIYLSLQKIKSKFIFFCDQDDFINFDCLQKKEIFLIGNAEYSAIKGFLYNFVIRKNSYILKERSYPKEIKNKKILLNRVISNFRWRSYYCLHRTKNLLKIFRLIVKNKTTDVRTAEFILDISTLHAGQIHLIKECSALRWSGNKYVIHPISMYKKSRYEWFFSRIFRNDQLINSILLLNKNLKLNPFSFKFIILMFDILPSFFRKLFEKFKYFLIRLLYFFKISFLSKGHPFKINKINQIFSMVNNRLLK
tara:strand:- start:76 stop:1053 length:978 start_codon:yes stop_codon:yes gene_type:complete